jgi:hypothetical protein
VEFFLRCPLEELHESLGPASRSKRNQLTRASMPLIMMST